MGKIEQYAAVGLSPTVWGAEQRADIEKNLEHLHGNLKAATWLSGLELPVKLAVIPEGALQGFTDEVFDMDHAEYREEIAIDVPGPETEQLGEYAEEFGIYIVASAKEKSPDYPEKFVNTAFLIDPDGELVMKHRKITPLLPVERSVSPHDVWDDWTERHGTVLDDLSVLDRSIFVDSRLSSGVARSERTCRTAGRRRERDRERNGGNGRSADGVRLALERFLVAVVVRVVYLLGLPLHLVGLAVDGVHVAPVAVGVDLVFVARVRDAGLVDETLSPLLAVVHDERHV